MDGIFEIASNISTPLSLAGFIFAGAYWILKDIIKAGEFPRLAQKLSSDQGTLIIKLIFVLALVALVLAFFGYVIGGTVKQREYNGRVIDAETRAVIPGATVSLTQDQRVPESKPADSEGVFHFGLDSSTKSVHLRVQAEGYEVFVKNASATQTGIDEIALKPVKRPPTPGPTSGTFSLTYGSNPTLDKIRSDLERVRHVKIAFNPNCNKAKRNSVVQLNGAQPSGNDVKDFLDNVQARTDVRFSVRVIKEGVSYEIICY